MQDPINGVIGKADTCLELRAEDVAAKVIDGEALIMNVANGMYYSLTGTGAVAWQLLAEGRTLADAASVMQARFEVSQEQALADLVALADQLVAENLVRSGRGEPSAQGPGGTSAVRAPYVAPVLESYSDMADLLALDPPMPGLAEPAWIDGTN